MKSTWKIIKAFVSLVLLKLPWLPIWLGPLFLYSTIIFSGKAIFWGTTYLQFVPWRHLAAQILADGSMPLWNPLVGMGAPLLANYQAALLYPPIWFLILLDWLGGVSLMAWGQAWVVVFHLILSGVGMAKLMQAQKVGTLGQTISGLAYCLCQYQTARAQFLSINAALAWTPWVLLGVQRLVSEVEPSPSKANWWRRVIGLALIAGMQLLSGHAQITYYTFILALAWTIFWALQNKNWKARRLGLAGVALAGLLAISVAAAQLLPTAEFLAQSQRASAVSYDAVVNYSFLPIRFLTLAVPNLLGSPVMGNYLIKADNYWEGATYLGVLPLLLALTAVGSLLRSRLAENSTWNHKTWRGLIVFWICVISVGFVLALGKNTPIFPFLYHYVPSFAMFQSPARFTFWAEVGIAFLAGISVSRWQKPSGKARYWTNLATAGAGAVILGAIFGYLLLDGNILNTIIPVGWAGLFGITCGFLSLYKPDGTKASASTIWSWLVAGFLTVDLVVAGWNLNQGTDVSLYKDNATNLSEIRQVVGQGRLYLDRTTEETIKFRHFFTLNDFKVGSEWRVLRDVFLPNANILDRIPAVNNFDPLVSGRYAAWMERLEEVDSTTRQIMLNLMDVTGRVKIANDFGNRVVVEANEGQRVRWASCAVQAIDGNDALGILTANPQMVDLSGGNVILEAGHTPDLVCQPGEPAEFTVEDTNANRIRIKVTAPSAGWMVLSDTWYPGWEARIDGKTSAVLRANYLFRAVPMEAGEHRVEFLYRPTSFYIGCAISLSSLAVILGLMIQFKVGQRKAGK